jgi:hypothetical protein
MARILEVIWGEWEQKYFSENPKKDSTRLSTNRPTGKSLEPVLLSTPSVFRIPNQNEKSHKSPGARKRRCGWRGRDRP